MTSSGITTSDRSPTRFRHLVGAVLAVSIALVAVSCTTDTDASDRAPAGDQAAAEDLAGLVDIGGGRHIYMECRGSGGPTVVLVSGLDTAADLWDAPEQTGPKVLPEVAETTRVCAYDRPGAPTTTGQPSRSDDIPQPSTPVGAADDLHALLQAADVPGPYVLAAHSYGGLIARLYAADHPDDVAGVVLVDVVSPELRAGMSTAWWEHWKVANARTPESIAEYPPLERIEFDEALDQVEQADPLRPMPLVVISADELYGPGMEERGARGELPAGVPAALGYVIDSANKGAQQELAELVPGAEHLTATHSGHNVMIDNAPLVVDAIDSVVRAVREHRTTVAAS